MNTDKYNDMIKDIISFIKGRNSNIINNLKKEIGRGTKKLKDLISVNKMSSEISFRPRSVRILKVSLNKPPKPNSSPKNIAIINGQNITLPAYLQGPPVTLGQEEIKRSVYIFERSLLFMARFFFQSTISIIYIPGPASTYSMAGPNISFEAGEGQIREKVIILKASHFRFWPPSSRI